MILRRVVERLKKEHWTGVFIELVIVVLGVFIGLQVDNWNQDRGDARLGRDYVKRLVRDLDENLAAIRAQVAYYSAVRESVVRADALLKTPGADPRTLVIDTYRASEIAYNAPVSATWDQIVGAGHLGLLPTGAIESGLSQYYSFDSARNIYMLAQDSAYRKAVRKIIPLDIQIALRRGCSDIVDARGYITGFTKTCDFDVDPDELVEVATVLRDDPEVTTELRYQYSLSANAVNNLSALERNLVNALTALGAAPAPRATQPTRE